MCIYTKIHILRTNKISAVILRVPGQNGVSQARYIAEIHHSGRKPSVSK